MAVHFTGPLYVGGVLVIDADGNVDAPITTTDLTTTGNTTLGNATSDTLAVNGNSTFTGTATGAMVDIVATTTTTGKGLDLSGNTALTTGILAHISSSATAITGAGRLFYSNHTGATGTSAVLNEFATAATDETILAQFTASGAITGGLVNVSMAASVTGIGVRIAATAATLTTGAYLLCNDGAASVFSIGANGHIHTVQTTAPTIAVSQQNGITAAAITAGGSDTCGEITTTGTNNNGGTTVLQVTFNKTYTIAPKGVLLFPANASGALTVNASGAGVYVSAITATTFDITIPADAAAGATPSWRYLVIA